jgi:hypothetical protein
VCVFGSEARAQFFGQNKVEYIDFDFKVFETQHFDIYSYPGEEASAALVARLAERWYARLSRVLGHELKTRQPLILYGSHPEFAQTNVVSGWLDEGIGGVTESSRRRIVMPFAPTLEETDRVLGHELVHAFQFDILGSFASRAWPRWATEGLAQYLSHGSADAHAVMWLRDAAVNDLLPERESDAARMFSPYRYGHAMWAYLAGRFGDEVLQDLLNAELPSNFSRRIQRVTGVDLDELYTDWRAAARKQYGSTPPAQASEARPLLRGRTSRIYLSPALSPDGRSAVFFSEQDRLSVDLFLADAEKGIVTRKLATLAANARLESLEAIRSAGSWSEQGTHVAFAAIEQGRSALMVVDLSRPEQMRSIRLPKPGQVLAPSWSPDGRALAFSVLEGGTTDLYIYELATGTLRQLTDDVFADLHPAWSPDGQQIAFATDRFSTDLTTLRFGACQLAVVDVASGHIRALPAIEGSKHLNPQWSGDGTSVYFIADPGGISNVYRLDLTTSSTTRVTNASYGVTGMIDTSPALTVARKAPVVAFTVYRGGRYQIQTLRGDERLRGVSYQETPAPQSASLPAVNPSGNLVDRLLADALLGLPDTFNSTPRAYAPALSLDRVGQPYFSSGGGPLGGFVRAGGSLLFGDLLGNRMLFTTAQVGGRLRDVELGLHFLNRERRWNWGALAELEPTLHGLPRRLLTEVGGEPTVRQETEYFQRIQLRFAGLVAYPLSHARRIELTAGVRHAHFQREIRSRVVSLNSGRRVNETSAGPGEAPATLAEVSAALVGDTAVVGPTSPILGSRYRFEIAPAVGGLSSTRLLMDYRRYLMPVRPYTVAARIVHLGQYGSDATDPRIPPTFLGSRYFVRGYGWNSIQCQWNSDGHCTGLEGLLGNRAAAASLELRAPLVGMFSRSIAYGPVPLEAFVFADAGAVWSGSSEFGPGHGQRHIVSSTGLGVRVNAFRFPVELAAIRGLEAPARGWSFDFSLRTGF